MHIMTGHRFVCRPSSYTFASLTVMPRTEEAYSLWVLHLVLKCQTIIPALMKQHKLAKCCNIINTGPG